MKAKLRAGNEFVSMPSEYPSVLATVQLKSVRSLPSITADGSWFARFYTLTVFFLVISTFLKDFFIIFLLRAIYPTSKQFV